MQSEYHIYIVFSSTPYKMGRFIRMMTHSHYNHIALTTDPSLRELYSFARHYRNTPFYGGFVRETGVRYRYKQRVADIKVCALPVTEDVYRMASENLEQMLSEEEQYIYNLLSAILVPLGFRVRLPNAYTCVEFVTDFLKRLGMDSLFPKKRAYSIREVERLLSDYEVYQGPFPHTEKMGEDPFERKQSFFRALKLTLFSNARLIGRFFKKS